MEPVALPATGLVYVDTNVVIYTVEKHPHFGPLLRPLWTAVSAGGARVFASELALLETLVGPFRADDDQLVADYETFFELPGIELVPISRPILRNAARLRADLPALRSPDAIHAATAFHNASTSFVTNDAIFRSVPGLTSSC
jgi:predicted nucleic acid-binding protein